MNYIFDNFWTLMVIYVERKRLGELCKIKIGKMRYYFPNFFAVY